MIDYLSSFGREEQVVTSYRIIWKKIHAAEQI